MPRTSSRRTAFLLCLSVLAIGCEPGATTRPLVQDRHEARGGKPDQDVVVESVDPSQAPQDTTLTIEITGTGFDAGSEVALGIGGVPSPDITTNSVTVVNSRRIKAEISISTLAQETEYDVMVFTNRGKKGIGTEMFLVVKKNNGQGQDNEELISFTSEPFDITEPIGWTGIPEVDEAVVSPDGMYLEGLSGASFFGCPDVTRLCNRVVATFRAKGYERVSVGVEPVAEGCRLPAPDPEGGCINATEFEDRTRFATYFVSAGPSLPFDLVLGTPALVENPDGTLVLTLYWQGQRGINYYDGGDLVGRGWSTYPDLARQGFPDRFVFRMGLGKSGGGGVMLGGGYLLDCAPVGPLGCSASHQGRPADALHLVVDSVGWRVSTRGRGKKQTVDSVFGFNTQFFDVHPDLLPRSGEGIDYLDPATVAANPSTWATAVVMPPAGPPRLPLHRSTGRDPNDPGKPDVAKDEFELSFDEGTGCYEVRVIDGYVTENQWSRVAEIYGSWIWDQVADPRTIRIDRSEAGTTWEVGATCGA